MNRILLKRKVRNENMPDIAICDDNAQHLKRIYDVACLFFQKQDIPYSADCYSDGEQLLKSGKTYDIYLLDVIMPGVGGIELAKEIRDRDKECILIYLTTSSEYALHAYQVDALQYLIKPVEKHLFFQTMAKAMRLLKTVSPPKLSVPTPSGLCTLVLPDIIYVEHLNKVLYFHMADGSVIRTSNSSLALAEIAPRLLEYEGFICPHRAFIVNMDYITVFSGTSMKVKLGAVIPVSQKNGREVKKAYMDYLLTKEAR